MKLDTTFVRSNFPAFSEPSLRGQAFFENAGGSYACQQVIDRLTRFYRERKVQPYYPFEASRRGGAEMDEARERLSALLGVKPDELSFGPSTTQNTYVLAQAFGEILSPGDAIIVTEQDHEANSGPWRRLADRGIEVRDWKVDPDTGHLPVEGLKALLDDKMKLVCFPHCSNVIGEINPAAEIVALAHEAGAYACVDGVSFAPHGLPDIGETGADIYLFSAYKTFGPHQGIMSITPELAERLPNQAHYFNGSFPTKRFTPAGPDHAQIAACAGMVDYMEAVYDHHFGDVATIQEKAERVRGLMAAHEAELLQPLLDYLAGKNSVRLLGPADAGKRAATVSVVHERLAHELAQALAGKGIMAGGGGYYANRLLEAMGLSAAHGVLRLSFVHYTERSEVEALMGALEEVL